MKYARLTGRLFFSLTLFLIPIVGNAQSFLDLAGLSPHTQYKTFETEHFTLTYPEGFFEFSKKAATELEHAHEILSPLLKWQPRGRTHVLVTDNQDAANGFAMPPLRVGMVLLATPPDAYFSTAYTEDWIKLLVFHEYTHILNIDPTTEWMEWLRYAFGDIIRPNGLWPIWMLEGLAVYFETRTSVLGRGRSPYYESILRAYYREGKLNTAETKSLTLDRVNGNFPYFPGGETPYLFGYHLWQELALEIPFSDTLFGEYSIRSSHRIPYFINGNLENLTQKSWDQYWDQFVNRSETRMSEQIKAIEKKPITPTEHVTHSNFHALGGAVSPNQQWLAYTESTLEKRESVVLVNRKTKEKFWIDDKILGSAIAWSANSDWIIYSALRRFDNFNLYSELLAYQISTAKIIQLTEGGRAKDPVLSADGKTLVYIKNESAQNVIVKAQLVENKNQDLEIINPKIIYRPSSFAMVSNPKFELNSNDKIIFSLQEINKPYSDLMSLTLNQSSPTLLFHNGKMNRYPCPSEQGLFFVSDLSGVQNIYLLTVDGKSQAVTNSYTDILLPFISKNIQTHEPELNGSMITSDGIEIVKINVGMQTLLQPSFNPLDSAVIPNARESIVAAIDTAPPLPIESNNERDYSPLNSLAPRQWAPIALFTSDNVSGTSVYGDILGFDSTGKHQYFALAGYRFKTSTADALLQYTYYGFLPKITLSFESETNNIGSGTRGDQYRRNHEAVAIVSYPFFWTYSYFVPSLYGFMSWNRLYNFNTGQPVSTRSYEYSEPNIPGVGAQFVFSDSEKSILSFMPERGQDAKLAIENRNNERENVALWKYLASYSRYILLGEHQVLKPKVSWSGSSHFFNTLNSGILTNLGTQTTLNEVGVRGYPNLAWLTKSAAVISADYSIPVDQIFRGWGTTPAFLDQLYATGFVETGFLPTQTLGNIFLPTIGASVNLTTTLLIRAPLRFELSYAQGLQTSYGGDTVIALGITADDLF